MRTGSHILCLRRICTKRVLGAKHDTEVQDIPPESAFDPKKGKKKRMHYIPSSGQNLEEDVDCQEQKPKINATHLSAIVATPAVFVKHEKQALENHCCLPNHCI